MLALSGLLVFGFADAQFVPVTGGAPAVQDFNSLANSGTSGTLPPGWHLLEVDTGANTTYAADDGSTISGNTYSYGTTSSTERALGALQSGSVTATIGAQLRNETGATLNNVLVTFTAEQWRRGNAAAGDRLEAEYSLNATSVGDAAATWIAANALDVASPVTTGALIALDGNLAANRVAISGTLSALGLAPNATFWIRWLDSNASGNDDGLAIDDISFALPGDFAPLVISSAPAAGAVDVSVATSVQLAFSESIAVGNAAGITLACGAGNLGIDVDADGATLNIAPQSALPFGDLRARSDCRCHHRYRRHGRPMAAPFTLTFDTEVDDAPILMASTPIDGATDFPANASLQLTFSEAVTLGASWFQIVCGTSGTRNVGDTVVTGGPIAFGINPNTDFAQGESCALELNAAQILDQDGVANAFVGDASIAFTPAAPVVNQLPTVLSTTPMRARRFPPSPTWSCSSAAGDVWRPRIHAQLHRQHRHRADACEQRHQLHDRYRTGAGGAIPAPSRQPYAGAGCRGANPAATPTVTHRREQSVGGYYSQVNPSSPDQLRCSLHETIKGHTCSLRLGSLEMADEDPTTRARSSTSIATAAHQGRIARRQWRRRDHLRQRERLRYNREHVWPRSLGFNNGSNNLRRAQRSAHAAFVDKDFNAHRGNKPFATCTQASGCSEDAPSPTTATPVAMAPTRATQLVYCQRRWQQRFVRGVASLARQRRARSSTCRAIRGHPAETAHDGDIPDLELTDNRSLIVGTSNTAAMPTWDCCPRCWLARAGPSTHANWSATRSCSATRATAIPSSITSVGDAGAVPSTQPPTCVLGWRQQQRARRG